MLITLSASSSICFTTQKLQAGYFWWHIMQFTSPEQFDLCGNMPIHSYDCVPVLPVNVSRPYFITRSQGTCEKFGVWGRDYASSGLYSQSPNLPSLNRNVIWVLWFCSDVMSVLPSPLGEGFAFCEVKFRVGQWFDTILSMIYYQYQTILCPSSPSQRKLRCILLVSVKIFSKNAVRLSLCNCFLHYS